MRDATAECAWQMRSSASEKRGIKSVLVEGGAQLFASFVAAQAWDVLHVIVAPKLFGAGGVPLVEAGVTASLDAVPVDAQQLGADYRVTYFRADVLDALLERMT